MVFNTLTDIYTKFKFDKYNLDNYKYLENYILNLYNNEIINEFSEDSNIYFCLSFFILNIDKSKYDSCKSLLISFKKIFL